MVRVIESSLHSVTHSFHTFDGTNNFALVMMCYRYYIDRKYNFSSQHEEKKIRCTMFAIVRASSIRYDQKWKIVVPIVIIFVNKHRKHLLQRAIKSLFHPVRLWLVWGVVDLLMSSVLHIQANIFWTLKWTTVRSPDICVFWLVYWNGIRTLLSICRTRIELHDLLTRKPQSILRNNLQLPLCIDFHYL